LAGGNSGDPKSKHFNDQAEMYQKAHSKMYFSKEDVEKMRNETTIPENNS
jgi:acyl-homoserine lactone acylase PvdQ